MLKSIAEWAFFKPLQRRMGADWLWLCGAISCHGIVAKVAADVPSPSLPQDRFTHEYKKSMPDT